MNAGSDFSSQINISSSAQTNGLIHEVLYANKARSQPVGFLRLLAPGNEVSSFSYTDVMDRAELWADCYAAHGLEAGDRVVIILQHSIDIYTAFLGALLGGFVPAMFAFPSPKHSETAYFTTIGDLIDSAAPRLLVVYPELGNRLFDIGNLGSQVKILFPADASMIGGIKHIKPVLQPDDIAFLQYSSGTTGLKKGVAISHRALLWQIEAYSSTLSLRDDDVIVSWLPLYHDMGLIACLFLPFVKKIPLVAMSPFDWVRRPAMLLDALTQYRGTLCWLPNFAYNFLASNIQDEGIRQFKLSHVRGVVNCSEPLMTESHQLFMERFASCGLRPEALAVSYAMAENTFAVTSGGFGVPLVEDVVDGIAFARTGEAIPAGLAVNNADTRRFVSSGRPLPHTEIRIINVDGASLGERQIGEIAIRSPSLLSEYYHNTDATSAAIRSGWLHTGDLGYLTKGELFVTGRKKDLIIVGGQNIYPHDVETIVNKVPGVYPGRCVALGVRNKDTGTENLVILAEVDSDARKPEDDIVADIYNAVASTTDAVPSDIRLLPHMWLVKSSSGKIARQANLERYLEMLTTETSSTETELSVAVADHVEEQVRNVVQTVLAHLPGHRGRNLGLDDPIVSSGLIDSFGLVGLIVEIEHHCRVRISDRYATVDNLDTIRRISALVERLQMENERYDYPEADVPRSAQEVELRNHAARSAASRGGFWTWYYRALFSLKGVRFGRRLQVRGPLMLQILGDPSNLVIGDDVTLMPWAHLKLRGKGRIVLGNGVLLDSNVRLVAANEAQLELGDDVKVGIGTVMNAGADLIVGCRTLIAGYCTIDSSEHCYAGRDPVACQGYTHSPVYIGADVWLGGSVFIEKGSCIGQGAIVGVRAVVAGDIPAFSVAMGMPARVVKYRV